MKRMNERFVIWADIGLRVVGVLDFISAVFFDISDSDGLQTTHYVHAELGVRCKKHYSLVPPILPFVMIVKSLDALHGLSSIHAL